MSLSLKKYYAPVFSAAKEGAYQTLFTLLEHPAFNEAPVVPDLLDGKTILRWALENAQNPDSRATLELMHAQHFDPMRASYSRPLYWHASTMLPAETMIPDAIAAITCCQREAALAFLESLGSAQLCELSNHFEALSVAAFCGNVDVLRLLVDAGAQINKPGSDGLPPAAHCYHAGTLDTLYHLGADLSQTILSGPLSGKTVLQVILDNASPLGKAGKELAKMALDCARSDPTDPTEALIDSAFEALKKANWEISRQSINELGLKAASASRNGVSLLLAACAARNLPDINRLLKLGASPGLPGTNFESPLSVLLGLTPSGARPYSYNSHNGWRGESYSYNLSSGSKAFELAIQLINKRTPPINWQEKGLDGTLLLHGVLLALTDRHFDGLKPAEQSAQKIFNALIPEAEISSVWAPAQNGTSLMSHLLALSMQELNPHYRRYATPSYVDPKLNVNPSSEVLFERFSKTLPTPKEAAYFLVSILENPICQAAFSNSRNYNPHQQVSSTEDKLVKLKAKLLDYAKIADFTGIELPAEIYTQNPDLASAIETIALASVSRLRAPTQKSNSL